MQSRLSRMVEGATLFSTLSSTVSMLGALTTGNSVALAARNAILGSVAFTGALASLDSDPANTRIPSLLEASKGMTNTVFLKNLLGFIVIPTLTNLSGSLLQYLVSAESPSFMQQTANTLVGSTLLAGGFRTARVFRDWMSPPPQAGAASSSQNVPQRRV